VTAASCSTSPQAKSIARVALLFPLSGERAELGKSLERAARLAAAPGMAVNVIDTGGSPEGARKAAKLAFSFKADIVIGPVSADEAREIGITTPVLTLSNDEALSPLGLFVLGVTATQSTNAVLTYARASGVKTVAIMRTASNWGARCEAAAIAMTVKSGMRVFAPVNLAGEDVVAALKIASEGELPNAVLIPDGGPALEHVAGALRAAGIQILGTSQWSSTDVKLPATQGAWIATADAQASAKFADAYTHQFGEAPGVLAGLAYDAMLATTMLARTQQLSRAGLSRAEGFSGVSGLFRFPADGRSERRLAMLIASPEGARPVAGEAMAWA
jgi:branched-chain amino acid transport system substrate-binding protein